MKLFCFYLFIFLFFYFSDISKLKQEYNYFRQSFTEMNKLNQRLLVMGMCVHHREREQMEKIKYFQTKFIEIKKQNQDELNKMENILLPKV